MAYIAIDIGHGTNTAGKGVRGYKEHDFNSKLGLRLKQLLELNGHKVLFGQKPNSTEVPLGTRTSLYNREKVDLVVSIHANANSNSNLNGRCAFYWHSSSASERLANLVIDEIKAKGYSTHGNGLHAGIEGSWTNLHINRVTNMPAVLIEHGFMTGNKDFDLIFGSKQSQYIEDMAQADARAIQRYFGRIYVSTDPVKVSKPKSKPQTKTVEQLAKEVIDGKYGTGDARRKALGNKYSAVQKRVNEILAPKAKPTPTRKPNATIAQEVIDGKWGNNPQRKQKLEKAGYNYSAIQSEVNKRAGGKAKPKKSIDAMAREVIAGKHGNGHANRRKSLEISQSEYEKVRRRVNQLV